MRSYLRRAARTLDPIASQVPAAAQTAPATPSRTGPPQTTSCELQEFALDDTPGLIVSLPEDHVLLLVGGRSMWDAHCGDRDPRILFSATTHSPESRFDITLELAELAPT